MRDCECDYGQAKANGIRRKEGTELLLFCLSFAESISKTKWALLCFCLGSVSVSEEKSCLQLKVDAKASEAR